MPELGGRFDAHNPSHKMLMSVLGGMSESQRQHVQARVRAAMDTQVVNEGRHQGGRAPYGYRVIDGGPHPNPRKAAEGYRLRVLDLDPEAAEVVARIFTEYLDGRGDRGIANGLNRDGIPVPVRAASRPEPSRTRHRILLVLRSLDAETGEPMSVDVDPQDIAYWLSQDDPVVLIGGAAEGELIWKEVSDYLLRENARGALTGHVAFTGERFDLMSVRTWRDSLLAGAGLSQLMP